MLHCQICHIVVIVEYKCNMDVEMAEKLDKWLTLPNFKLDLIKATSEEEFNRAVQLCTNNCIDLIRIIFHNRI